MKKIRSFLIFCILLTGCWDVVNIEDRGFIVGSAIDIQEDGNSKQPEFMITNQIVVPAGMISVQQESDGGEQAFINFTSTGKSIYKMKEEVTTISSKVPYYEHLEVLIISDDVAMKEHLFSNLLDTYSRDVNLRRGINVIVSKGEGKKLLEFTSPNYKLPAIYIDELLERGSHRIGLLKPTVAGNIEEFHLRKKSYVLPYLQVTDHLEYSSGAVFHGPLDKMIGVFNADEMHGLSYIIGEQTPKIIDFPYKGESFAVKVIRMKNRVTVNPDDINRIKAKIHIELETVIKETFAKQDFTKSSVIAEIQQTVSKNVKDTIEKVIQKGQEEFGTDVFEIWRILETKHYDAWKQVREDWEEGEYYFKDVEFDVNVVTEIYSTGTTEKAH